MGTQRGHVLLFSFKKHSNPLKRFAFESCIRAHKNISHLKDNRFGSLVKYAEVWNVCLSPCKSFIASCSEDQTAKIYNLKSEDLEYQFGGHATAITGIDWKQDSEKEFFTTCADDCKILMYFCNDRMPHSKTRWILFYNWWSKRNVERRFKRSKIANCQFIKTFFYTHWLKCPILISNTYIIGYSA